MTPFFRFPRTPHIAWLGNEPPRDDKVLTVDEVRHLLAHNVLVEEKVDGANLGFSVSDEGDLRVQNRGSYISLDAGPQWKPLRRWLAERAHTLTEALFPDLMLFGEWCYAVHSIHYTALPDWFLAFDVYDRAGQMFWSAERRNVLAAKVGIAVVPVLSSGRFDVPALRSLLDTSRLTNGPAEGLYVRRESRGRLVARGKLVRREFAQGIGEHWSRRAMRTNSLAAHASADASMR